MTTVSPRDIQRLLETSAKLEDLMEAIYTELSRLHVAHPKVASLWRKMAREEANHSQQFKFAVTSRGDMIQGCNIQREDLESTIQVAADYLKTIQASVPQVEHAMRATLALEEASRDFHLDCSVTFRNDGHKRLFSAMMAADEHHVEGLRKALQDYAAGTLT